MYFDTHTHANFESYEGDKAVTQALAASTWMINVGTTYETSKEVVDLAEKYERGVYAAVGLHPGHTYEESFDKNERLEPIPLEVFEERRFIELAKSSKVVAIGECGLDYYRLSEESRLEAIERQKNEFIKQLRLAKLLGLPLTLHCREAYADMLQILSEFQGVTGVVHSFTDTWDTAKQFLDLGFLLGLNGILTFDKTGKLQEVCEKTPIEKIVTETDAPYLAPVPFRGKRNQPEYVEYVVEKIAEIKGLKKEEAASKLFQNAINMFKIEI